MTKIGAISNQILAALENEGKALRTQDIISLIQEPPDEILMGIGWLIREGYLQMETVEGQSLISFIPGPDVKTIRKRVMIFENISSSDSLMKESLPIKRPRVFKSSQRYSEFVETMRQGIYMTDVQGQVVFANQAFVEMLGYREKEDVLGLNLAHAFHMNSQDYNLLLQDIQEKGFVSDYELKYVRKDGKVVILSETSHLVKDAQGRFMGIDGIVRDITERKRLEEQMIIEKMKLEHILSLHEEISSILKLEELVDFVIAKAVEVLDAHRCSLMLVDKERNELCIKGASGLSETVIQDTRIKLGDPISGLVALYGEPMIIADMDNESPVPRKNRPSYKGKSFMSVPIKLDKKVIGVVNVTDKGLNRNEVFTQTDLRVLSAIVRQAAVAIENANLYRELKYLSITDPLTGLYNHRHFLKTLDQEIKRLKRYPAPLCLMMIDVDHFKSYNDTYGHPDGDFLLKEISRLLGKHLRETDVACRYGGDEFAIILVETKVLEAEIVAKKFQKAAAGLKIKRPLTVSIGIAACAEQLDRHELILKADRALYQSKKEGRNRISIYA